MHQHSSPQEKTTPIWPFMLVLAFLFGMSVTAPRSWEKYAHRNSIEPAAAGSRLQKPASVPFQTRPQFVSDPRLPAQIFGQRAEPQPRIAAEFPSPTSAGSAGTASNRIVQTQAAPVPTRVGPRLNGSIKPSNTVAPPVVPDVVGETGGVVLVAQAPAATPIEPTIAPPKLHNGVRLNGGSRTTPPPVAPPQPAATAQASVVAPPASQASNSGTPAPSTTAVRQPQTIQPAPRSSAPPQLTAMRPSIGGPVVIVPQPQAIVSDEPPSWWPTPTDLLTRLQRLSTRRETRPWAERTSSLLSRLAQPTAPSATTVHEVVGQLRAVANDPSLLDERRLDAATAVELRLTRHALLRRLDIWESLGSLLRRDDSPIVAASSDLAVCLAAIERQTGAAGESGRQWHDYLMLDALRQLGGGNLTHEAQQNIARQALTRLAQARDASDQNAFLKQGSFATLDRELRRVAAEEIDVRLLLTAVEQFEAGALPTDAHALAAECQKLAYASDPESRQLATWLTSHYRNANVRLSVSSALLNRMLPEALKQDGPVNETLLGYPTKGWGTTRTGLAIQFLPSSDSIAVRLEAQGTMNAQTKTYTGAVRLFNHSNSHFAARKDFALTFDGLKIEPAEAAAQSRAKLRGIDTNYDRVPILGPIVEAVALDEHKDNRIAALREVATKTSRHVERGLDAEIDKHLEQADLKLHEWVIAPLGEIGIDPELIELQSNETRAVMRLRIAGAEQLASHTPRPRVDDQSLASLQIHQSAANNILERSKLEGRRFTAPELYRLAVDDFGLPDTMDPADIPADLAFTFAAADPMTVRFHDGRAELRLALRELRREDTTWEDITVCVDYKPTLIGGKMCLVRDGIVQLSGPHLGTTSQISLRTIFSKVFPDDAPVELWPEQLRSDPRFADLDIDRVELRDGWMGTSISKRPQAAALLPPKR